MPRCLELSLRRGWKGGVWERFARWLALLDTQSHRGTPSYTNPNSYFPPQSTIFTEAIAMLEGSSWTHVLSKAR
jgi:hypothetical protein